MMRNLAAAATRVLKETVVWGIRWSGLPWLLRSTYGRDKVSIVVYHDPRPEVLDRHLRYLSKRYAFSTIDAVVDAARSGDWESIPPKCLVVTLDDGYRGNFELLDVFARHGVVPTIYACTQVVATRRRYWWTACPNPECLKRLPNAERLRRLREQYGFVQTDEDENGPPQALSEAEIRLMVGRVSFGSHSRFHPILPACSTDESREEIALSKTDLERLTGKACRHFSYPNGDFSQREVELLEASGYHSARTTMPGWNARGGNLFALRVIGSPDHASVNHLASSVVTFFLKRLVTRRPAGLKRDVEQPGRALPEAEAERC